MYDYEEEDLLPYLSFAFQTSRELFPGSSIKGVLKAEIITRVSP